ncbi:MAG: 4Fe-4S cluster-binding domain-containing protein, partial [Oscillospiraceae bacterium]|nr:4Fe-4S cluster-binding domain-containing protein [Oscillospiraceae bacterium]
MNTVIELTVTDIHRFCMHDGPGTRTVVFLKGCPLRCEWCHNPETRAFSPELSFTAKKCVVCGACAAVCPAEAQRFSPRRAV